MADKVLRSYVHVVKKDGSTVELAPGQAVPAWATKQVTNPDAFADETVEQESTTGQQPAGGSSEGDAKAYADQDEDALRALLKERELPQEGDKAALIARLDEADAEAAANK